MASEKRCCIPGCGTTRKKGIVMHSFPNPAQDLDRYLAWTRAIKTNISDLDPQYVFKYRRVCHVHFETKYLTWTRRLSPNAIPTLYLPESEITGVTNIPSTSMESEVARSPMTDVTNIPSTSTGSDVPVFDVISYNKKHYDHTYSRNEPSISVPQTICNGKDQDQEADNNNTQFEGLDLDDSQSQETVIDMESHLNQMTSTLQSDKSLLQGDCVLKTFLRSNGIISEESECEGGNVTASKRSDARGRRKSHVRHNNAYQCDPLSGESTDIQEFFATDVIPDFDPTSTEDCILTWVAKVEECAETYGWDEKEIIQYSHLKLCDVAKTWYQGLPTTLETWAEWKKTIIESFIHCEDYAELITVMLNKRVRYVESLEHYYYTKMNLINRCGFNSKQAIDCLLNGVDDADVKVGAKKAEFTDPEQVLIYFRSVVVQNVSDSKVDFRGRVESYLWTQDFTTQEPIDNASVEIT